MDVEAPRGLLRRFDEVEDPCVERTKLHGLRDIPVRGEFDARFSPRCSPPSRGGARKSPSTGRSIRWWARGM